MIYLLAALSYIILFILVYLLYRVYYHIYGNKLYLLNKKGFVKILIITLPVYLVIIFFYVTITLEENHYSVKKNTLLWHMCMNNSTINNFPIIENYSTPQYDWIGSDVPSINGGWQLRYKSKASKELLEKRIIKYLESKKFRLTKTDIPYCNWFNHEEGELAVRYIGTSENEEECLDIAFRNLNSEITIIEVSITR